MVWKASQFVGVGIAKFPYDNTYVVVVQYQPPGNINTPRQFRRNVPVPTFVKSSSKLHESNVVANDNQNRDNNDLNRNAEDEFVSNNFFETDNDITNEHPEENPDLNAKQIQTVESGEPSLDPIDCNDISHGNGDVISKSTWQTLEVLSDNDAIESDNNCFDEVDKQNVTALAYVGTSTMDALNEMTHDDGDLITVDKTDRPVTTSIVSSLNEMALVDDDLPLVDSTDIPVATHIGSSLNEMAPVVGEFIETDRFTKDDIDRYEQIDELDTSPEAVIEWNKQSNTKRVQPNTKRVTIV